MLVNNGRAAATAAVDRRRQRRSRQRQRQRATTGRTGRCRRVAEHPGQLRAPRSHRYAGRFLSVSRDAIYLPPANAFPSPQLPPPPAHGAGTRHLSLPAHRLTLSFLGYITHRCSSPSPHGRADESRCPFPSRRTKGLSTAVAFYRNDDSPAAGRRPSPGSPNRPIPSSTTVHSSLGPCAPFPTTTFVLFIRHQYVTLAAAAAEFENHTPVVPGRTCRTIFVRDRAVGLGRVATDVSAHATLPYASLWSRNRVFF